MINLELPFTWELLWIASLIFLASWILYIIFCPGFIIEYPTYQDYLERDHDPRWIVWESKEVITNPYLLPKFFDRLKTKKLIAEESISPPQLNYPQVEEKQTKIYFKFKGNLYSLAQPMEMASNYANAEYETEKAQKAIFWEIFGRFSSSKKWVRLIILLLFFTSIALVLINVGQNIISGFEYLYAI
jgi:hypothetical protein